MVFKECGQSKRVHSKKRERETQIEGLKNGARIPGFGTRYIHTVEGYLFQHDTHNKLITTKDGDADNCAGEASFQQHYTQVPYLLY